MSLILLGPFIDVHFETFLSIISMFWLIPKAGAQQKCEQQTFLPSLLKNHGNQNLWFGRACIKTTPFAADHRATWRRFFVPGRWAVFLKVHGDRGVEQGREESG